MHAARAESVWRRKHDAAGGLSPLVRLRLDSARRIDTFVRVSDLTIGLLGALLATNQPLAVSNLVQQQTGVSVAITNPNDPAEKELQQLMEDDDAALAEVDRWIQTNNALTATGAGETKEALNQRIHTRLDTVRANRSEE